MATLLYTIFGITASASLHCAVRREISPCTCSPHETFPNTIIVTCERMDSFNQVVDVLQDKFTPDFKIWLRITHSQLLDFEQRHFAELNMNIRNLRLNNNNLSSVPIPAFHNLTKIDVLSLADNLVEEIPKEVFEHTPNLGTLDIARGRIKMIRHDDFKMLKRLEHLVLATNEISVLEKDSFPHTIKSLHIGRNNISSLNGTLRNLNDLSILFINSNNLTTLDDELPLAPNLLMLMASNNRLVKLPEMMKHLSGQNTCFINENQIRSLDGLFSHKIAMKWIYAEQNKIEYLAEDEFLGSVNIDEINLSHNLIPSLNKSLLSITNLRSANFSVNLLREFSLQEIYGLMMLRYLDLSHNRIEKLTGRIDNLVETTTGTLLFQLLLHNNLLKSLDGALAGLSNLRNLKLSDNLLENIYADDFDRMEDLELLDISNNRLKTLQAFEKVYLPTLETLNASYNLLTTMGKDFHGLPVLCAADLSKNMISSMTTDLVSNTRCSNHGVPNTLEIFLDENPVLCDENLPKLVEMMEMNTARLLGVAHCIVTQPMAIETGKIVIQQPPISLLQTILKPQQLQLDPNQIILQPPSIIQIIIPAQIPNVIVVEESFNDTALNNTEIVETVIQTTLSPNDSILEVISSTVPVISTTPIFEELPLTSSEAPMTTTTVSSSTAPSTVTSTSTSTSTSTTESTSTSTVLQPSTTPIPNNETIDEIESILLNEDELIVDETNPQDGGEDKVKRPRDKSDFKYVETFEQEKPEIYEEPAKPEKFEPDPIENVPQNDIPESFSQNPLVMTLPEAKALSLSIDSVEPEEPPEELNQTLGTSHM